MSAVLLPPPATILGVSFSFSLYCVAWQIEQLKPTRSKPIVFLENPTGNSLPSCHGRPKAAYPPGPGMYCVPKILGRTTTIQYGIPALLSDPMDPYRKFISWLLVIHSGC